MSTTLHHHLRTFCAQYLNDFGEECFLVSQEVNALNVVNQLKQIYTSETVSEVMENKKQSIEYWNRLFPLTATITKFSCKDIVATKKQPSQTAASIKSIAYMQVTFDWILAIIKNNDGDDQQWLLKTEGRHLLNEQPLFSAKGM